MNASDRPLARAFEAASNALTAWKCNRHVHKRFLGVEDYATLAGFRVYGATAPTRQRAEAGHTVFAFCLDTIAATHDRKAIAGVYTIRRSAKESF